MHSRYLLLTHIRPRPQRLFRCKLVTFHNAATFLWICVHTPEGCFEWYSHYLHYITLDIARHTRKSEIYEYLQRMIWERYLELDDDVINFCVAGRDDRGGAEPHGRRLRRGGRAADHAAGELAVRPRGSPRQRARPRGARGPRPRLPRPRPALLEHPHLPGPAPALLRAPADGTGH